MTAEPDLLPCPFCGSAEHLHVEHLEGTTIHPAYRVLCDICGASSRYTDRDFRAAWNARANVAHATAAKDAEIEALRADYERAEEIALGAIERRREAEALAERLAEALREIANQGPHYGPDGTYKTWRHWAEIARAALEQEAGRG